MYHNRNRSPGNGYNRSYSVGMGMTTSQISPEGGSVRSHAPPYNSSQRGFKARGRHLKPTQPPPSPQFPRKGDIFIEAGRLAMDYLAAQGLLPPDVRSISGKCPNGSPKINSAEFQDPRPHDRENTNSPVELGRSSAPSLLDNVTPDGASGKRSSQNDHSHLNLAGCEMDRRRFASSKSYSSEWNQESRKIGSWSDNLNSSQDVEHGNGSNCAEIKDEDSNVQKTTTSELAHKNEGCQGEIGNCQVQDNNNMMNSSFCYRGNLSTAAGAQIAKNNDVRNTACQERKDDKSDPETDAPLVAKENYASDSKPYMVSSTNTIALSNEDTCSNFPDTDNSRVVYAQSGGVEPTSVVGGDNYIKSLPAFDKAFSLDHRPSYLPEVGACSSMGKDRGEKRALGGDGLLEETKKAKQCFHPSEASEKLHILPGKSASCGAIVAEAVKLESSAISMLPKGSLETSMEHAEEKQLFPCSFKICDLNLTEGYDANENVRDQILMYPSFSVSQKELGVHIDLSMSNNRSLSSEYAKCGAAGKDVELIDLENDSPQKNGRSFTNSSRKTETDFSSMQSFPNNSQSSNDNTDRQDGYGFMISELLGANMPNCSMQPEINSSQNEIGLHHGEVNLGEDDPIYMSLGEIPISLLHSWDQPAQDYEKPF